MKNLLENFWLSMSGKSPTLVEQCSSESITNILFQGQVIFFTAFISGGIFAATIADMALHNIALVAVLWPICFWLISTLDKSIVSHYGSSKISYFRVALALAMGFLLSNFLHLVIYKPEIDAKIAEKLEQGLARIEEDFAPRKTLLLEGIAQLKLANKELEDGIKEAWDYAEAEAVAKNQGQEFGEGEKYKGKKASAERIVSRDTVTIRRNEASIRDLEIELGLIEREEKDAKTRLSSVKTGISHRNRAFSLLLSEGTFLEKMQILFWILPFFALDMLPLIIARSFPSKDYNEIVEKEEKGKLETAILGMQAKQELEKERIAFEAAIASIQLKFGVLHRQRILSKQETQDELKVREEWFESILEQETKWEKAYPKYYEAYLKPSIEKALNDYKLSF